MKDLIVLAADAQQEAVLRMLLEHRRESLGIRPITLDTERHAGKDPGVYSQGAQFLSVFASQYHRAIVVLDEEWEGGPNDAEAIALRLGKDLDQNEWQGRHCTVVIAPELDVWVWADSPHVEGVLGLDMVTIRNMGLDAGFWPEHAAKPTRPKELLERVLRRTGKPRSSALYAKLARRVSLASCTDPAFRLLRDTLRAWFPVQPDQL